jgi:hypothetical protein
MRMEVVDAIVTERDEKRLLKDVVASVPEPMTHSEAGRLGGRGNKKAAGDAKGFNGTNVSYLAARLKRDQPDIAARIDEFPSMRAAAGQAGLQPA